MCFIVLFTLVSWNKPLSLHCLFIIEIYCISHMYHKSQYFNNTILSASFDHGHVMMRRILLIEFDETQKIWLVIIEWHCPSHDHLIRYYSVQNALQAAIRCFGIRFVLWVKESLAVQCLACPASSNPSHTKQSIIRNV